MKHKILAQGPAASRSGYGGHFRDIMIGLINSGKYDIQIVNTSWGSCPDTALSPSDNPDHLALLQRFVHPSQVKFQPDLFMQCSVPNEFQKVGKKNLGITAGIETTLCSPKWINGMNQMDRVIVPSQFSKSVFDHTVYNTKDKTNDQVTGVLRTEVPIDVVFEGLDTDVYNKNASHESIDSIMESIPEDFAFLSVGHWLTGDLGHDRKDIGMVIKQFCEAFKNKKKKPALILKTSGATFSIIDREEICKKIRSVKSTIDSDNLPKIYLIHGDLTDHEMAALYNHSKVKSMISFTKGEGFGRPLLEFAATGKPIIVSSYSGHLDFLQKKYTVFLDGKLGTVHESARWDKDMFLERAQWYTVDYNQAKAKIKDVFSNYKTYQKKASGSSSYVQKHFNMKEMDNMIIDVIDSMLSEVPLVNQFNLPGKSSDSAGLPAELPSLPNLQS